MKNKPCPMFRIEEEVRYNNCQEIIETKYFIQTRRPFWFFGWWFDKWRYYFNAYGYVMAHKTFESANIEINLMATKYVSIMHDFKCNKQKK